MCGLRGEDAWMELKTRASAAEKTEVSGRRTGLGDWVAYTGGAYTVI